MQTDELRCVFFHFCWVLLVAGYYREQSPPDRCCPRMQEIGGQERQEQVAQAIRSQWVCLQINRVVVSPLACLRHLTTFMDRTRMLLRRVTATVQVASEWISVRIEPGSEPDSSVTLDYCRVLQRSPSCSFFTSLWHECLLHASV